MKYKFLKPLMRHYFRNQLAVLLIFLFIGAYNYVKVLTYDFNEIDSSKINNDVFIQLHDFIYDYFPNEFNVYSNTIVYHNIKGLDEREFVYKTQFSNGNNSYNLMKNIFLIEKFQKTINYEEHKCQYGINKQNKSIISIRYIDNNTSLDCLKLSQLIFLGAFSANQDNLLSFKIDQNFISKIHYLVRFCQRNRQGYQLDFLRINLQQKVHKKCLIERLLMSIE